MLWIVQFLVLILIVGSLVLLFPYRRQISIWKVLIALSLYATGLLFFYDNLLIKQFIWAEEVSKLWVFLLAMSLALATIAIFHYFNRFFISLLNVKPQFIGLLIGIIGVFAILSNQYSTLFWLLITFGVLIAGSRFIIPKNYALKSLWLTLIYLLPLTLVIGFVLIKTGTLELINISQFVKFTLFTVEYEFLLMMIIPNYALLLIYNLSWEKVGSWFNKVRIVK